MAKAYSYDLRIKVMQYIENGSKVKDTAKIFGISRKVIFDWKILQKATGSLMPKSGYQKGHSHKIKDTEVFKAFLTKHHGKTTKELAIQWNEQISCTTILRAMKKLGLSYKKNISSPQKR
jgi:transposase